MAMFGRFIVWMPKITPVAIHQRTSCRFSAYVRARSAAAVSAASIVAPSHLRSIDDEIAALGIARTYQNVRLFSGMTSLEQVMTGCWLRRGTSLWA